MDSVMLRLIVKYVAFHFSLHFRLCILDTFYLLSLGFSVLQSTTKKYQSFPLHLSFCLASNHFLMSIMNDSTSK